MQHIGSGVREFEVLRITPAIRRTMSICSRVACTAVAPGRSTGTNTDQNWPPTPPRRRRLMSVISAIPMGGNEEVSVLRSIVESLL
jgi:hypothetical protein